jgi:dihydroorotase
VIVIRGGMVVGPTGARRADVAVEGGVVTAVGESLEVVSTATVVDATGCWVGPAFVDLHTHLREPGGESAETVQSGARAAAVGGYGAVVAMPNTEPAIDSAALVIFVRSRALGAPVEVAVAGAITRGRAGEVLAPLAEMAALGVKFFTDDGAQVADAALMRRALLYARPLGVRLAQHAEEGALVAGGVMNEGSLSSRLGLGGRPAVAETVAVARDLALAEETGAPIHLMHLSTARAVELVAAARAAGVDATCEVAPHHLVLTEEACADFDPLFKVNPPLRSADDVSALGAALRAGTIDALATDHAPHPPEAKERPFDEAAPGVLGLEHAAAVALEVLGGLQADPVRFFSLMSRSPARIAGLDVADPRAGTSAHGGAVAVGEDANLVVFDPTQRWVARRDALQSRADNSPYDGREMVGRVRATMVRGSLVALEGEVR